MNIVSPSARALLGAAAALEEMGGIRGEQRRWEQKRTTDVSGFISIAVFNHKGGVGKSTHATLTAAGLAKAGYRVGVIDADPQLSQSIQWADDDLCGQAKEPEDEDSTSSDDSSDSEDDEGSGGGTAVWGGGEASSSFRLPYILRDELATGVDALHPETMRNAFGNLARGDNLYSSLKNIGLSIDPGYLPNMRPCNMDDYKGRLLLLPSCAELFRYNDNLVASERTDLAGRVFGAFGKLMRGLADKYKLDFMIVDLGPHTDHLHKVIISSCDFIQLVVDASMAAWASSYSLLTGTLPAWIKWHREFKPAYNCGDASYHFNPHFPRILPVLGLRHTERGRRVDWSSSNIYTSIKATLEYEEVPREVRNLYQPCADKTATTMFIPFLKNLAYLPVAQETGRAFCDLTVQHMQDYFHNNMRRLSKPAVDKERRYAEKRYKSLAKAMAALREHTLRAREQQAWRQQQQQQQQQGEGGNSKKRFKKRRRHNRA